MTFLAAYSGLFAAAFIAATLFPMQSEAVLVGLIVTDDYSVTALVVVASIGNTLGSAVNWLLGRGIERFRDRRWFPVKPAQLDRAIRWYGKFGRWSLLMAWLPIGGDALTVVAGVLKEPLWSFGILVFLGKLARYAAVAAATLSLI